MADAQALRRQFAAADFLKFDTVNGLVKMDVAIEAATAAIFLQGAHLTAWQPAGEGPVIFFSRKSELAPGRPLRGGVPIAFPWFSTDKKRDRIDGHPGPTHGFARIQDWTLQSAARKGDGAELVFTLGPTELTRSMGFDHFELKLTLLIGRTLTMRLHVLNEGAAPLEFEEAFHTYFHVTDIHEVKVTGLEATGFSDKTDNFLKKPAEHAPITFTKTLDRIYENTSTPCEIYDGAARRTIRLQKMGSNSTVVWNPFRELPDIGPWDWHEMVALETANVESNRIMLAPGASNEMRMDVSVRKDRS